jgi:hypothetical protein
MSVASDPFRRGWLGASWCFVTRCEGVAEVLFMPETPERSFCSASMIYG